MENYRQTTHPARQAHPPLQSPRLYGNHVVKPELDWSAPLNLNSLQSRIFRRAQEAIGLPPHVETAKPLAKTVAAVTNTNLAELFR